VGRVGQIARDQDRLAARFLDQCAHFRGIVVFVEVGDQYIGSLPGEGDGDRAADTAVGAGDHRRLTGELAASAIGLLATVGDGCHHRLDSGYLLLLFRETHDLAPFTA
jgi:hypothetical protein